MSAYQISKHDESRSKKLLVALLIATLFIIFHQRTDPSNKEISGAFNDERILANKPLRIQRVFNPDASLSVPFLDKINKYWHVGGSTQIRNFDGIRLTNAQHPTTYGTLLSNGIGDNTINDFETTFNFKISSNSNSLIGDGVSFLISSENEFVLKDLRSSFALRQYVLNSGGVMAGDTSLMGFPKNLPGLVIVLDTFSNTGTNEIPFIDIFLNINPQTDSYELSSDGERSTSKRLNTDHIPLKKSILNGDIVKLKIIYMESVNFLKIDIQYESEGNYWIELFQSDKMVRLPKNSKSGQRYIGVGAMNGYFSESVELFNIHTSEYHWDNGDESIEDTLEYAREAQLFLAREFNHRISMEVDELKRWKMSKSQPNYQVYNSKKLNKNVSFWSRTLSFIVNIILFVGITVAVYLGSVYIRVSKKHLKNLQKRRRTNSVGLLPT